jgi:hypothetical protein
LLDQHNNCGDPPITIGMWIIERETRAGLRYALAKTRKELRELVTMLRSVGVVVSVHRLH